MDRPGAAEAKAIQRNFQWSSKLREINKRLAYVSNELSGTPGTLALPPLQSQKFDALNTIKTIESEARKSWEASPPPMSKERYGKLQAALDMLSRRQEEVPAPDVPTKVESNEWSSYAKAEEERRGFLEATYRRFRMGPVQEVPAPRRDSFDYEEHEFSLPSGGTVQQPVAFVKTEVAIVPDARDRYRSSENAFTVGVNTDPSLRDVEEKRIGRPNTDREAFLSQLIARTAPRENSLVPGQRVSVCYFGVRFPASVLRRNFGSGTFTVRFDDGTVNDFPIHAIIQK